MAVIQYLTNTQGKKTAVQVPIKEWEAIQTALNKPNILEDLAIAYGQMKDMRAAGAKGLTKEELMQQLFGNGERK